MPLAKTVHNPQRYRSLTSAILALLIAAILATAVLTQRSLSRLADSRDVITHALIVNKALLLPQTSLADGVDVFERTFG